MRKSMSDRLSGDADNRTLTRGVRPVHPEPESADPLSHRMPAAPRGNRDMHIAWRNAVDVGRVAQQRLEMMHLARWQACRLMQIAGNADIRMLLQVLANPRTIDLHLDASLREMRAGTDTAPHQHHRTLQSAGRHDDLPRGDSKILAIVAGEPRSLDAPAGDDQPIQRASRSAPSGSADAAPRARDIPMRRCLACRSDRR